MSKSASSLGYFSIFPFYPLRKGSESLEFNNLQGAFTHHLLPLLMPDTWRIQNTCDTISAFLSSCGMRQISSLNFNLLKIVTPCQELPATAWKKKKKKKRDKRLSSRYSQRKTRIGMERNGYKQNVKKAMVEKFPSRIPVFNTSCEWSF